MALPVWEFENLIKNYHKQEARSLLNQMRVVNAGFNGGDSASLLIEELTAIAYDVKSKGFSDVFTG